MTIFEMLAGWRKFVFGPAFGLLIIFSQAGAETYNPKLEASLKEYYPPLSGASVPAIEYTAHNRGNIQLAIANNGTFGTLGGSVADPFTGEIIPSCIYPKGSDIVYLWVAAMWIGAVVGRDTLVTTGNEDWYQTLEFLPEVKPYGDFRYKSIDINSQFYDIDANSEEDIFCEYTDTIDDPNLVTPDPNDRRPHIPLNISIAQRSMAWSYSYADDFILFDYQIQNIGTKQLRDVYMGIFVDGDVWHTSRNGPDGWNDDIVGFYPEHPAPEGCGFIDTINVAYTADNDGDPVGGAWNYASALGTVGVRVIRTPSDELKYSYNWWIINYGDASSDFGPRKAHRLDDPFRQMGSRLGTPAGDRNKYYVMRHEEFDYDLMFTALDHSNDGYQPKPENAEEIAEGFDTRYLLSFGPFNINPGDKLPISFAWVGGRDLHVGPNDFKTYFDPAAPWIYYDKLDFSSLASSSRWASWVYDNPGVDTDSDGYAGKFRVCHAESLLVSADTIWDDDLIVNIINNFDYTRSDTFWHEGDGVPDFSAAGPPPSPKIRIIPSVAKLTVRWNGFYSETTPDIFSQLIDFEGYRIYRGLDDRPASFSLLASYDLENYNRYRYTAPSGGNVQWVLEDIPFTLDSLKSLFGDPEFDPLRYTRNRPFDWDGESYYFTAQDYNLADISDPGGIHRAYPEATNPGRDRSFWVEDDLTYEHGEGLPRFYEYEYIINDLLPTVEHYVAVTAFDFGSPIADLAALETDMTNNFVAEFALQAADSVEAHELEAYVYPNPYRVDDNYAQRGFENRFHTQATERARLIHFANLPKVCKISIYSIDGDLIRELEHNRPEGGPGSMHESWDLITRNTQSAASGLYYFVIESDTRKQIGKFVIIR